MVDVDASTTEELPSQILETMEGWQEDQSQEETQLQNHHGDAHMAMLYFAFYFFYDIVFSL